MKQRRNNPLTLCYFLYTKVICFFKVVLCKIPHFKDLIGPAVERPHVQKADLHPVSHIVPISAGHEQIQTVGFSLEVIFFLVIYCALNT